MKSYEQFTEAVGSEQLEPVAIEVLGSDNNWRRVEHGVFNRGQNIARTLQMTKQRYPNNRVRAVGQNTGMFIDLMV